MPAGRSRNRAQLERHIAEVIESAERLRQSLQGDEKQMRQLSTFLASHRGYLLQLAQKAGLRVAELAQNSWLLILVPILAAFFLKDGHVFSQAALSVVHSKPQREFMQGVISDMNQMLVAVAHGQAVAYVPISTARQHSSTELAFVPVSDLSPSEVVAAWPDTSRSRAVAGFVRAAAEVAASHAEQAAALA